MSAVLENQRRYLAQLLEAAQRCAFFLDHSLRKLTLPVDAAQLSRQHKDPELFEALAAINERFAKMQDILASAMRHTAVLMGESTESFLKILALFEKLGVIESVSTWQQSRAMRNLAAHEYDLDYVAMAEHVNALHDLFPTLLHTADRLLRRVAEDLAIEPASADFTDDFAGLMP